MQDNFLVLPNSTNFIKNVGLNLLPTSLSSAQSTSLSLCSVDLTSYNGLGLDAVILSTNPHLAPQTGFLHSTKSLIGKLCDLSADFKTSCSNHPPIAPGQLADMGQHIFIQNLTKDTHLKLLQIILTTTHKITIASTPAEIKDMMTSYINGLLYLNNQAEHQQKKINVALTLFGTGHYGWAEDQVLILAVKSVQYLIKNDKIPNINAIYFVSNNIKSLKLTTIFNKCLTDDTYFTNLLPRDAFNNLLISITNSASSNLSIKTMLEPSHNQRIKQNVCIYLTMHVKEQNKMFVVFGNKDVSTKKSRQIKNFITKAYNTLKVPGGRVDDKHLSIVETALKELQEETGIELKKLSKAYPNANLCYTGSYELNHHAAYLHCYWIDLGEINQVKDFTKQANHFKGGDDVNHVGLLSCDEVLEANNNFKLPGMEDAKEIDKLNQKMLKRLLTKNNSYTYYPLKEIESFGLKMEFETEHQNTLSNK